MSGGDSFLANRKDLRDVDVASKWKLLLVCIHYFNLFVIAISLIFHIDKRSDQQSCFSLC